MIPKTIHYCWFGRNPLPNSALKCIESWKKYFPDYEIKEWNEDNFDVNSIPYTAEAYAAGKYAFVSDYARFKILYEEGGIYFDTDVEVIKDMTDLINQGPFMGIEVGICNAPEYKDHPVTIVAPGLGLGATPGMRLYNTILSHYSSEHFIVNGTPNTHTVGEHVTSILREVGLKHSSDIQKVEDILIYPMDWFNPLDDATGKLRITKNTVSIHWYSKTWLENNSVFRVWISRLVHRVFGTNITSSLRKFFHQ